jgi:Flp pilus assembly protein TadG
VLTRARGQVVVIFAAALPVVLAGLGLALDGGYYFLAGRGVQFAAGAAARAAALNVQANTPLVATANGQALGAQNLSRLQLTAVSVTPTYKSAVTPATECTTTASGWSAAPPTNTNCVRAVATATYNTLFMRLLQVPSVTLQRTAIVTVGRGGIIPLAVCNSVMTATPGGPWTIWDDRGSLCQGDAPNSWDGYVGLDGNSHTCAEYRAWILPGPPTGPVPQNIRLQTNRVCTDTRGTAVGQPPDWLSTTYYTANPEQVIVVIDPASQAAGAHVVLGCRRVRLIPNTGGDTVAASPVAGAGVVPCASASGIQEIY